MVESYQNNSLYKLKEVRFEHDSMFIYPASKYITKLNGVNKKVITNNTLTLEQHLIQLDNDNRTIMFREILKYNEKLRNLQMRGDLFDADIFKMKYAKTKIFLHSLCDFILSLTTMLYYKKLFIFDIDQNLTFEEYFGEQSRGADWSFDKAYSYAISLEETIRNNFEEKMKLEYPIIEIEKHMKSSVKQHKKKNKEK